MSHAIQINTYRFHLQAPQDPWTHSFQHELCPGKSEGRLSCALYTVCAKSDWVSLDHAIGCNQIWQMRNLILLSFYFWNGKRHILVSEQKPHTWFCRWNNENTWPTALFVSISCFIHLHGIFLSYPTLWSMFAVVSVFQINGCFTNDVIWTQKIPVPYLHFQYALHRKSCLKIKRSEKRKTIDDGLSNITLLLHC